MKGYWNKILRVNLTEKTISIEEIDNKLYSTVLGGAGLAAKILLEEVPPKADPLSAENKLIFATGPFQGSGIPGSGRWVVVGKSALTGTYASSNAGAAWGDEFKKCGYDAIVVEGKATRPLYLFVKDNTVELRDAFEVWGMDTVDTFNILREKTGESKASVACIGVAGEKQAGVACIVADKHSFAARCGLGAVMGSKNLKAIVVKGSREVEMADPDKVKELTKELSKSLAKDNEPLRKHGTVGIVSQCDAVGDLPVKYWQGDKWPEGAEKIGAPRFTELLNARPWPCRSCPIGCHRHVEFDYKGGKFAGAGAEYETAGMLGSCCLLDDLTTLSIANDRCNRLGIDTISTGAFIGFAMTLYEKGIITQKDTGGIDIKWGDGEVILELIEQIGTVKMFGANFQKGIRAAAKKFGPEAQEIAVEVKGLDWPAHDPRSYFSLAITYATSPRGACHLHGFTHAWECGAIIPEVGVVEPPERFNMQGIAPYVAIYQDFANGLEALVSCCYMQLGGMSLSRTLECLEAVTGEKWTSDDFMTVGERIFNMQRLINVMDGLSRKDDRLPKVAFEPAKEGFRAGKVPEPFEETLESYYSHRGWDTDGRPTEKKLRELGLEQYGDR